MHWTPVVKGDGNIILTLYNTRCILLIMKRTQIQIPDPLYKEVRRVAVLQEWSVSEVFRRAAEHFLSYYPPIKKEGEWELPEPRNLGNPKIPPGSWRDRLTEDESRISGVG
jgi:hypothetical protein